MCPPSMHAHDSNPLILAFASTQNINATSFCLQMNCIYCANENQNKANILRCAAIQIRTHRFGHSSVRVCVYFDINANTYNG